MVLKEAKLAGLAAMVEAGCYVFGFVMLATLMNPGDTAAWSRFDKLEFIAERALLFHVWHIVIYVVFGVVLVILTALLRKLFSGQASLASALAAPFGYIWAGLVIASGMLATVGLTAVSDMYASNPDDAVTMWSTIATVQDGLGGGVEVVGAIWVLLISIASLRSGFLFPKATNILGILVGVAGITTVIPGLSALGAVFGLLQIVWFIAIGVALLRFRSEHASV